MASRSIESWEAPLKTRVICFTACIAASAFLAPPARAAAEAEAKPSQQSRFSTCAHESKGLKGDDHQNFMSACLKGNETEAEELKKESDAHRASAEPGIQHTKMKTCNDEAGKKNLHGDERRTFMSECLKG
jgi:psiF repeat